MVGLIKKTNWNIENIAYSLIGDKTIVSVKQFGQTIEDEIHFGQMESTTNISASRFQIESILMDSENPFPETISFKICYNESQRDIVQSALHYHIKYIFNFKSKVQIEITTNHELKSLPVFTDVDAIAVCGEKVEAQFLNHCFSVYPPLKSARIEPKINGQLAINSSLFNASNLHFHSALSKTLFILENFQGRNLSLERAICSSDNILSFINKWISNSAYQSFESVEIELDAGVISFRIQDVERQLNLIQWNQTRRPQYFYWNRETFGLEKNEEPVDCGTSRDVERDGDMKLATVILTRRTFKFLVWN